MATNIQKEELEATTAEIAANKRAFLFVYDKTLNSMQYVLADGTTVRDLLTLDAAGENLTAITKLGIGTLSPACALHLQVDDVAGVCLLIRNDNSTGDPLLRMTAVGTDWSIGVDNSNGDAFTIAQATTLGTANDRVTIKKTGEFGLGTDSPLGILDIFKSVAGDTSKGLRYNVGENVASTGTSTRNTADPYIELKDARNLTDDGILNVVDEGGSDGSILTGYGEVICAGRAHFRFNDGVVTLLSDDGNVTTTDTDVKLNILGTGAVGSGNSTIIQFKNRAGSTKRLMYRIWYSKDGEQV